MPLENDLQRLIHPDTTNTQIIEICQQYSLVIEESQLSDTQALQKLQPAITDQSPKSEEKRQLAYVLLYRAGEPKYASMFKVGDFNLFEFEGKIENILQLLNPKIKTFPGEKPLKSAAYDTLIGALGVCNIRALPLWLQIMLYKAFSLSTDILNVEDYNHKSAAAGGFDIENIMRLAKMLHTGIAEKESQEKLALAAWGKVYQTDRKFTYEGQTAEQAITAYRDQKSMATAIAFITAEWFSPYEKLPLPLLFKIGNAYKAPQVGVKANTYAAALCYALVLRLQSEYVEEKEKLATCFVEAKEGLAKCFNEGSKHFPPNLIAVNRLQTFYTAQPLPATADAATAASVTPSELDEFIVLSLSENNEETAIKRLVSLQNQEKPAILIALDILGIKQNVLSSPKFFTPSFAFANGELIIHPSKLESVVNRIKQRNEKFKKLKRHETYASALKTVAEFIAVSNKIALEAHCSNPEVYSPESSLYEKIRKYGETIKPLNTVDLSNPIFIQAVSQGLLQGIAIIEELNALLTRIRAVQAQLPNPNRNPFAPSSIDPITWFPGETEKLAALSVSDSALIGAMQFSYKKLNDYMESLNGAIQVLSRCLQNSEKDSYTEEDEKLLEFWDTNKTIPLLGKVRGFTETHERIAQTKPRLKAATCALEIFVPSAATQATETKLDTLTSVLSKLYTEKICRHHANIALLFRKVTTFIEQERQAKDLCRSLRITKKEENLSWQETELQERINKKAKELFALTSQEVLYAKWRALIEGLRTKTLLGIASVDYAQTCNYLGLPRPFKRADILAAMDRLEAELNAYKEIESLIAEDRTALTYPADTDNEYTRARNRASNFKFASPHHFETQLPLFKEIREKEINAKEEMDRIGDRITSELHYSKDGLRDFIAQQLETNTYQQSLPILKEWFEEEKKARDFLNPYLPTATQPIGFVNWLKHLPGAQDILQQILGKTKSYSQALTALNTNVQRDYDLILAEYDQLEAAYRRRYKLFSPSQDRLNKIAELLDYKQRIVNNHETPLVEKYALLLGALKKAYDTVKEQHIKGREGNNNSFTQFFKERVSSSELVEVLEASLSVSAPSIVKHGFFGNTRVLTAPILITTEKYSQRFA